MSILLSLLLAVPALAVRSDSCADELRIVHEALAVARAEYKALNVTLQRHGLAYVAPDEEKDGEVCCCKASRCDANELGSGGARAQEVQGDKGPLCCKYTDLDFCEQQKLWNETQQSERCLNIQEQELSDFAKHVGPNTWQRPHMSQEELAATQKECEAEIKSFYTKVEEWASGKDTFHGHWIRTVHAKHLAEEISYQLFIEGIFFGVGSGAVRLFTLPQPVKMLWSGTPPDVRDKWKKKEHAGELSKETAFGKIVEAAGTLKSCDFGGVLTFWEATSSSFLNTDREKPVLVLVNKTEAAIKSTSLWRAEVPALARNPPEGNLRLVTWQMPCLDLVRLLERRIKEVVGPNVGSKRRWVERKGKMTCESVGEKKAATTYPPPFLMKEDLLQHGFTAEELKGLGFSASWMKDRRFLANETMEVGYSAKELKAFGVHHIKETKRNWLKEYSAKEFKEAGWSAKDLAAGGYNIWELHQGGYPADEMIKDGFSLQDLRVAGYSVKELRNFSALDLRKVGFTAKELGSGFPWWRLWSDGLPEKDLQGVRNSKGKKIPKQLFEKFQAARSAAFGPSYVREMLQQLKDGYGFTAKELKQADFTLKQLKQAGFSGKQLQTAGFTRKALMSAGFEREKLVGARSRP